VTKSTNAVYLPRLRKGLTPKSSVTWPLEEGVGHSGPISHEDLAGFFGGMVGSRLNQAHATRALDPSTGQESSAQVAPPADTPLLGVVGRPLPSPTESATQRKRRRLSMVEADPCREPQP
jgi:hypothetical protein